MNLTITRFLVGWCVLCVFFFKQKTAYEMRISDWSSDVCSSDLAAPAQLATANTALIMFYNIGSASGPIIAGGAMDLWRSEERRVGKECVSTCRSRWSPYH